MKTILGWLQDLCWDDEEVSSGRRQTGEVTLVRPLMQGRHVVIVCQSNRLAWRTPVPPSALCGGWFLKEVENISSCSHKLEVPHHLLSCHSPCRICTRDYLFFFPRETENKQTNKNITRSHCSEVLTDSS